MVKREVSSKTKGGLSNSLRNKNRKKVLKVRFCGERNPQKHENPNKIISFKAGELLVNCIPLSKLAIFTLTFRNIV